MKVSNETHSLKKRGKLFQTVGPKQENDLSPDFVFVLGTNNFVGSFDDLRFARPGLYGITCLDRYAGAVPGRHLKVKEAALKIIRFSTVSEAGRT